MEVVNELRKIYDILQDDESREVFTLRMEYLITGSYRPIEVITKKYLPEITASPYYSADEIMRMAEDRRVVVYAAGGNSIFYADFWKEFTVGKIVAFCDRNKELQQNGFLGYKVISPLQLKNEYGDSYIVVSSSLYGKEIKNGLLKEGFMEDQILEQVFPRFDVASDQYFDTNIIKFSEGDTEVYVDGGSMDLSSVIQLSNMVAVKNVYAFEPNQKHFNRCKKIKEQFNFDIKLFPYGLWSSRDELRFEAKDDGGSNINGSGSEVINVCALEDVILDKTVTFIKMDIEGAELEALKGCRNIIKRDKPRLAICIYHKPEDMYEIPMYIKELVPEYKLYIRHYSNRQFETVMYAVI